MVNIAAGKQPFSARRELFAGSRGKSALRQKWMRNASHTELTTRVRRHSQRRTTEVIPNVTTADDSAIDGHMACEWSDSDDEIDDAVTSKDHPTCCNCGSELPSSATVHTCFDGRKRFFCASCPSPMRSREQRCLRKHTRTGGHTVRHSATRRRSCRHQGSASKVACKKAVATRVLR